MTEHAELTQDTVVETLRSQRLGMLTCIAEDGRLHSHPMSLQEVTDDADVWFFISLEGEQAKALQKNHTANLAVTGTGEWLSLAGHVEFENENTAKRDELWDEGVASWFDGDKEDPNLGLVRLVSESAQSWGQPGGKVSALVSIVKARATGERPSGISGTTEL